ncbi:hypothetical protein AWENTII_004684 [Aspergillus wentii]
MNSWAHMVKWSNPMEIRVITPMNYGYIQYSSKGQQPRTEHSSQAAGGHHSSPLTSSGWSDSAMLTVYLVSTADRYREQTSGRDSPHLQTTPPILDHHHHGELHLSPVESKQPGYMLSTGELIQNMPLVGICHVTPAWR